MNWTFVREVGLLRYLWRRGRIALHRRLLGEPLRFSLPTGRKLICPPWSSSAQDAFVTNANMDWGSERLFFSQLDRYGDFLDVGANIGYYSLYAAPVVRRVFSFEPDPRNHGALEANAYQAGNILIQKLALSSEAGSVLLEIGDESSVSRVKTGANDAGGTTISVPATTLDDFRQSQPDLRVTGIKLDTEGHELPILMGGIDTIRRDQPLILTELMRWPGEGERGFQVLGEFSASISYEPFAFVPRTAGFLHSGTFRLVALTTPIFTSHATKMVFLVPARLSAAFCALARQNNGA